MSISFPKTWATGDKLLAEDVRFNSEALQEKTHKTSSGDWDLNPTNGWYDTSHIMDSRYSPTENISVNVSGVFGGRTNGSIFDNLSYISRWMSERSGLSTSVRHWIPMSTITFDILAPCTILFQWSMVHQSPTDGDGSNGYSQISAGVNNLNVAGQQTQYFAYEQPNTSPHNVLLDGTRQSNGVILYEQSSQIKQFSIGLVGRSTAGKCQNVSWSVSLECFYI